MRQPLHEHCALSPCEIGPLDTVSERFGPVEPVLVSCDAVGPANAIRHDAGHVGAVHPAAVYAGRFVPPVSPEHQANRHSMMQ